MTSLPQTSKGGLMPSLKIFLDASVILSGLASSTGGSRKLLDAAKAKKLKLVTTPWVIQEVNEHADKLGLKIEEVTKLLSRRTIHLYPNSPEEIVAKLARITPDPDDAPVLAGAVTSGARVLVSLDKKHILVPKVRQTLKPMKVVSPKMFWGWRSLGNG